MHSPDSARDRPGGDGTSPVDEMRRPGLRRGARTAIQALLASSRALREASNRHLRRAAKARSDSHALLDHCRKLRKRRLASDNLDACARVTIE